MSKLRTITITKEQQDELKKTVISHPKPYLRERAAAILKVAAGEPGYRVALQGLLRVRDPDTVYEWLDRYESEGLKGLTIRKGRGRKPAFSP
jgi:transposase